MPSPTCTVADGAGSPQSTLDGVNVTSGDTITIALQSTAGVDVWNISCIYTDETNVAATVTAGLTINALAKTATFTAPAVGSALIFQSKINNGKNADFKDDPSLTTTFGVFVLTAAGQRVASANQIYEGDHLYGWLPLLNAALRMAPSGIGVASKVIASTSAAITAGQGVCMADDGVKVTLADATAITAKGAIEGIAKTSGTAGQTILVAIEDALPASISGLGAGAVSPVRYNSTSKACERVTSYSAGDIPVGEADALGNVTMVRGIVVGLAPTGTCGGTDVGGTYPSSLVVNSITSATAIPVTTGFKFGTNPASSGSGALLRMPNNTTAVAFRNAANSADLSGVSSTSGNTIVVGDSANSGVQIQAGSAGISTVVGGTQQYTLTNNLLAWQLNATSPKFSQANNVTNSATAQTMTMQAQSATGTTAIGGDLALTPGTGTSRNGSLQTLGSIVEGYLSITPANGANNLSIAQSAVSMINCLAGATGAVTIASLMPATAGRLLFLRNNTSQTITFQWASGTGVTIATNTSALISSDGTNAIKLMAGT